MATIPFGQLISFSGYEFDAPSTPVSNLTLEWIQAHVPITGHQYQLDLQGVNPAPMDLCEAAWTVLYAAPYGTTDAQAYPLVQARYNGFLNHLRDFTGSQSNQTGYLVVMDADGATQRQAWARIKSYDLKLQAAVNTRFYLAEIHWIVEEDFS